MSDFLSLEGAQKLNKLVWNTVQACREPNIYVHRIQEDVRKQAEKIIREEITNQRSNNDIHN